MKSQSGRDLRVEVVGTVRKIDRKRLDTFADEFCYTYEFLKTLERTSLKRMKMEPRYVIVYEGDRMKAFTPTFLAYDFPYFGLENRNSLIKTVVNLGNHMGFHLNHGRTLVCDPPNCIHSKVLMERGSDAITVLGLISAQIDRICKKERILVSCFDSVSEFDKLFQNQLQDLGYFKVSTKDHLYLDIVWSSFDEYLNSLKRPFRHMVRREIRRCDDSGVTVEEDKNFENHTITLFNLWSKTYSKYHEESENPLDPRYFAELHKCARDNARVFEAKKNGKIVGFALCFHNRDVFDGHICGFDYDALTETHARFAYFNVCYYATIKRAIEERIRRVYYGFSTDSAKLSRGCKIEREHTFLKFHNPIIKSLVSLYLRQMTD
jgi:predicted N-acyltransferase